MPRSFVRDTIEKIVLNVGVGRLTQNSNFEKILPEIVKDVAMITGQRPVPTIAKKSIAGFKLRQGQTVGLKVTLRRKIMEDFLQRLIHVVLPHIRDFRGINSKSVDARGNLTIGIKEQFAFPEINPESSNVDFGFEVTIVPREKKREKAIEKYRKIGIPLKSQK